MEIDDVSTIIALSESRRWGHVLPRILPRCFEVPSTLRNKPTLIVRGEKVCCFIQEIQQLRRDHLWILCQSASASKKIGKPIETVASEEPHDSRCYFDLFLRQKTRGPAIQTSCGPVGPGPSTPSFEADSGERDAA